MKALVTAGATSEPIDDVRELTNFSKGGFGTEIARALAVKGIDTTLLGSDACLDRTAKREPFSMAKFHTFRDLDEGITSIVEADRPSIVIMTAAVGDYSPVPLPGKISSDKETLNIEAKRTPKILSSLRERCGKETFIVGFKLLSGVTDTQLIDTALRQVKTARTNLCVANDKQLIDFKNHIHPMTIVTPEGGTFKLNGHRVEVASKIIDFIMKREDVHWFRTSAAVSLDLDPESRERQVCADLMNLAQDARLLIDSSGNVSHRYTEADQGQSPKFFVSPRKLDKSQIAIEDLALAEVNLKTREVQYLGKHKSSIDTGVQAILYQNLAHIDSFLHFHPGSAIVIPDFETGFPYPCGTVEEADEILTAIGQAQLNGSYANGPFTAELVNHGYLLALEKGGVERIQQEWETVKDLYCEHLDHVKDDYVREDLVLNPILVGANLVGVLREHEDAAWHSMWMKEEFRKQGHGPTLVNEIIDRGYTIGTRTDCNVLPYYIDRGFRVTDRREDGIVLLESPALRPDLKYSDSICLYNPITGRALMGRRNFDPWKGVLCFPGGKRKPGESGLVTGLREFEEETGIVLGRFQPALTTKVYLGWNNSEQVFCNHNYLFMTYNETEPQADLEELDCSWQPLEVADDMAVGTKIVIRRVRRFLGLE